MVIEYTCCSCKWWREKALACLGGMDAGGKMNWGNLKVASVTTYGEVEALLTNYQVVLRKG